MSEKFECPYTCGIGSDCSECYSKHIEKLEAKVERLETTLESFAAVDRARQAENAALKSRLSDYEEDDEQCPHGLAGLCEQCIVEGK